MIFLPHPSQTPPRHRLHAVLTLLFCLMLPLAWLGEAQAQSAKNSPDKPARQAGTKAKKKNTQASHLLTPRELTIARMVTEGWPNKKIATKLFISEGTAKLHLHHVYQKLSCPGRMSLQRFMQEQGLM